MFEIPAGVTVVWRRPRVDLPAATNGVDKIWVDPALSQDETRCALAHEILHLKKGHIGHQPEAIEQKIRYEVARRLISIGSLRSAAAWAQCRADLREELRVTDMVLLDRLSCITDDELLILQDASAHHHP